MTDPGRLRALFGRPEYASLFSAARRRLEEAGAAPARSMSLPQLDAAEADAVAGLLGLPRRPAPGERLSLDRLDAALRGSAAGAGLRDVLEALGGPLLDRPRLRAEAERARSDRWERASGAVAAAGRPELSPWLEELRALGLVTRAASASGEDEAVLLERAVDCALRLPASGSLLPVLAAEVAGDAHALDPGRPLAGLVLRAAARLAGWSEVPVAAAERRRLWAEVGVTCDPLSAQVLVHALRPVGEARLARELRAAAEEGEPRRLTLRELWRTPIAVPEGTLVSVCENPSIVASAADRLGAACAPLVCVEGQPSTAAAVLLRSLLDRGARCRFHADFDWAGLRIGNGLAALGATPWRFSAGDYVEALASAVEPVPLAGRPAEAAWDPALAARMREAGRAAFEEQVVERLLADLAR